jgi:hypothetical protein
MEDRPAPEDDDLPHGAAVVLDTTDARGLAEFCRQLVGLRVYAEPAGLPFCIFVA